MSQNPACNAECQGSNIEISAFVGIKKKFMAKSKYKVTNMAKLPDEQALMLETKPQKKYSKKSDPRHRQDHPETRDTNSSVQEPFNEFGEAALETISETSELETTPVENEGSEENSTVASKGPEKKIGFRSKRYVVAKSHIDRTKTYSLSDAIDLLKNAASAKFDETVEVHLVLTEVLGNIEVSYPHSTGKVSRVQIFSDDLISDLEKGQINFDVLLATPAQMGKLTKFARLLGPKGIMPNPKNGTLIADPEKRKKELESGKTSVKGEKKSPLVHTTIGKISMDKASITENISALLKACQGKVIKAVITTTMSPGIKVIVS